VFQKPIKTPFQRWSSHKTFLRYTACRPVARF